MAAPNAAPIGQVVYITDPSVTYKISRVYLSSGGIVTADLLPLPLGRFDTISCARIDSLTVSD